VTRPSFEKSVARLEEIVAQLEGDELDLDRALRLFEEGIEHLRAASAALAAADTTLKRLSETASGSLELTDFGA
jgi:exodeoxyribonuclease VII small subunit